MNIKENTPAVVRDDGIDLLRALSMLMVVCMHVLGQGSVMVRYSSHPFSYDITWLLESFCLCAVNCYGIISGYVGVKSRWRPSRYIELYLTVWFYTAGITGVTALVRPELVTTEVLLKSLLPVSWKTYWYFSCFTAVFFLEPFLNRMVAALDDRERTALMRTLFAVFTVMTVVPKVFSVDTLVLLGGYSAMWLIVLYVFGACLRLTPPAKQRSRWFYLAGYCIFAAGSWGTRIAADRITRSVFGEARYVRALLTYHAPTMFLCAVCLLLAFRGIYLKGSRGKRIVRILSSTCFSVYLIHTHPVIWVNLLDDAFKSWARLQAPVILFPAIGAAVLIYLACTCLDLVRIGLFRLLKVRKAAARVDRFFYMTAVQGKSSGHQQVDTTDAH